MTIGDVRDVESLYAPMKGMDIIFHLAAEHRDDVEPESLYFDVNVQGAENLVTAAKRSGCKKVVFTSSVAVYPLNVEAPNENFTPAPFNAYGASKLAAEQVFRKWVDDNSDASVTAVRPCVIFGEGNRGNVFNLLKQVDAGTFLMIGDGQNRKSMAYVGNLVPFLISRMQAPSGFHLYNYADKPDLTTNELIAIAHDSLSKRGWLSNVRLPYAIGLMGGYCCDVAAKLTGRKFPISSIRVKKFCSETTVNTSKLELEKYARPFTLEQGLRRMIAAEFNGKR